MKLSAVVNSDSRIRNLSDNSLSLNDMTAWFKIKKITRYGRALSALKWVETILIQLHYDKSDCNNESSN